MKKLYSYTPGCVYQIYDKKMLNKILATGNFYLIDIHYYHRARWQFWKPKYVSFYDVMCINKTEIEI